MCSSYKGQDSKNENNRKDEKEAFYQGEIMALRIVEGLRCFLIRDRRKTGN